MGKIISLALSMVIATFNASAGNQYANNAISSNDEPVINGHEYIDLGLPSGLKWATCNAGAVNP